MGMRKWGAAVAAMLCAVSLAAPVAADQAAENFRPGNPVTDANPYPVKMTGPARGTTTTTGGTIAQPNVYQSALPADPMRKGCTLQNRSAANLRVFIGTPAAATDAAAFDVEPGDTFSCSSGALVVTDQIAIAGPVAGAAYTVARQ